MNNPVSPGKSIEKIFRSFTKNILSPLIAILGIMAIITVPILIWVPDPIIGYVFTGLFCLVLIFSLGFYFYFALKFPNRLHSEEHIVEMTAIALGSKKGEYIEAEIVHKNAISNLSAVVGGGAFEPTKKENAIEKK